MFKVGDRVVLDPDVNIDEWDSLGIDYDEEQWNWFFEDDLEVDRVYKYGDISVRSINRKSESACVLPHMLLHHIGHIRKELLGIRDEI